MKLTGFFFFLATTYLLLTTTSPSYAQTNCEDGYTCPDTSNTPVYGNTFPVESKIVGYPAEGSGLRGNTGPQANSIEFPELKEENTFFLNREFMERALPAHLLEQGVEQFPLFSPPGNLEATLAHTGCGAVTVNGEPYDAQINPTETKFSTSSDYNSLLLTTRFWQSIFVPGKSANLKYSAEQPENAPQVPARLGDCPDNSGSSLDAKRIENTPPSSLTIAFFGNVLAPLQKAFQDLLTLIGDATKISFLVKANVEQVKYMPGEVAFEDQTVGNGGFLNFFKPEQVEFTKEGNQEEMVPYEVAGQNQEQGIIFAGMSSFQSGKLDLENSIYPEGMSGSLAINPVSQNPISGKLDFVIPYMDTSVKISDAKKAEIIKAVKLWKADSRIEADWDTVYNKAVGAGINPAFVIAIWIEESAASSRIVNAASAFGCFTDGDTSLQMSFDDSLECFVHFTTQENHNTFEELIKYFCGPKAVPICSNNPNFLFNFRTWYDRIIPLGTPGAAQNK